MTIAKSEAPIEIINDVNEEIVNFYKQLRDHGDELLLKIELTPYARLELEVSRKPDKRISHLERARRFFITAMMAMNGSFGAAKGGFSVSNSYSRNGMEARVNRWYGMPEYLLKVVDRLRKVRIEHKDAALLLEEFSDRPATLIYLDPPYLGKRVKGYDHDENSEEFHEKLLRVAIKAKCMLFVSGYESELYNRMLTEKAGWKKDTLPAITKGSNGRCFARDEVIWFNRKYCDAKKTGRVPVKLSEKEHKDRKVNPTR